MPPVEMPVEQAVAAFVHAPPALAEEVRRAGRRSLLNMVGCVIGGAGEPAIDHMAALLPAFSGPPTCGLIGRAERGDMLWAAQIGAAAANIFDFDDTHVPTVIHPSAPVGAAVLALAEARSAEGRPVSGAALVEAFVLGVEITCRLGNVLHPGHYARGWHITSTCGIFGAALACGRLMGLAPAGLVDAMGHALAQGAGSVETLGTMSKSLSVGQAARGGLLAALLAAKGYTGPPAPLTGARGFFALHSDAPDLARMEGLGQDWEILRNTFKPYPCGVVLNPVIEACLALHRQGIDPATIAGVELIGPPLLRQRTDRPGVTSGRLAQVSAQHAVAVALLRGRADLAAFSDASVADPELRAFGARLRFTDDPSLSVEAAGVRLHLADGRILARRVEAAKGGLAHPLSDAELAAKLRAQIAGRRLSLRSEDLIAALNDIEAALDAAAFLPLTRPPMEAPR